MPRLDKPVNNCTFSPLLSRIRKIIIIIFEPISWCGYTSGKRLQFKLFVFTMASALRQCVVCHKQDIKDKSRKSGYPCTICRQWYHYKYQGFSEVVSGLWKKIDFGAADNITIQLCFNCKAVTGDNLKRIGCHDQAIYELVLRMHHFRE